MWCLIICYVHILPVTISVSLPTNEIKSVETLMVVCEMLQFWWNGVFRRILGFVELCVCGGWRGRGLNTPYVPWEGSWAFAHPPDITEAQAQTRVWGLVSIWSRYSKPPGAMRRNCRCDPGRWASGKHKSWTGLGWEGRSQLCWSRGQRAAAVTWISSICSKWLS